MNNNYKEIVTKAVIGKSKKSSKDDFNILIEENISNVLGCWVINHSYKGYNSNGKVAVNGSYDVNIWYSFDNNSKTNVLIKRFDYKDRMNVSIKENGSLSSNSDLIVRALSQPSVIDVKVENNTIELIVEKQMGMEVVGDAKVRVTVTDEEDDYEELINEDDIDINDNYLN